MKFSRNAAVGHSNEVIGHVFGGPLPSADSSIVVGTGAAVNTTLEAGKVYRLICDVVCYIQCNDSSDSDVTADTGARLAAELPEVFRMPQGRPILSALGAESGTLYISEMEV